MFNAKYTVATYDRENNLATLEELAVIDYNTYNEAREGFEKSLLNIVKTNPDIETPCLGVCDVAIVETNGEAEEYVDVFQVPFVFDGNEILDPIEVCGVMA